MIGVLTEVTKRVSGRWVTAVLLPGLLFVAVAGAALILGHDQASDPGPLLAWAKRTTRSLTSEPARLVLGVVLTVAAAGVTGTAASALGRLVQRFWMRRRSLTGGAAARSRFSRRSRALAAAPDAVPAYLPQRPTWFGDRVRLTETRIRAEYHVSASLVWPRLWLLLTDEARRPIVDARTRYAEAVTLTGWGLLYLAPGMRWWPALVVAACVLVTGWRRAREALEEWAALVEAAIDLRLRELAETLGMPFGGASVSAAEGRALDDRLGKAGPG